MSDDYRFVYADCAATTPVLPCAVDAFAEAVALGYGNPNSSHDSGRLARRELERARELIASLINAEPGEIAFTPSATAACKIGFDECQCSSDVSPYEHKAVASLKLPFRYVCGVPRVAHMLANNETGDVYVADVKELAKKGVVFTDATAAVGQIPVDVNALGVAALAAGGHKFGAFPGIGFVYVKGGITDEDAFPGTPPVALAVAMAEALFYRMERIDRSVEYLSEQRMALGLGLMKIPGCHINSPLCDSLPHILSVRFDGINARELLTMLDVHGVCASAGAACSTGSDEPSPTLLASGLTPTQAKETIRLSFCPETTPDDFGYVGEAISRCVSNLRNSTR